MKDKNPPEALQVEYRPTADLIPYARNSRTHSEAQVAQIASSIREFGFTNPVLVDASGGIIAGHGRVQAARLLGLDSVPTITLAHLTELQRRAYVIADNKLALNAGWDDEMLRVEFETLIAEGFDVDLTGFEPGEIAELIGDAEGEGEGEGEKKATGSLAAKFMIPPFSVLNAREGWWQDRKRAWLAIGIKSELGRGGGLTLAAEQVTSPGLNYYRDENKQRQGAAPGQRVTTASANAATAQGRQ